MYELKEEILELRVQHKDRLPSTLSSLFAHRYNKEVADCIVDIKENGKKYTTSEWMDLYNKVKDDESLNRILYAILKNEHIPAEIIEDFIKNQPDKILTKRFPASDETILMGTALSNPKLDPKKLGEMLSADYRIAKTIYPVYHSNCWTSPESSSVQANTIPEAITNVVAKFIPTYLEIVLCKKEPSFSDISADLSDVLLELKNDEVAKEIVKGLEALELKESFIWQTPDGIDTTVAKKKNIVLNIRTTMTNAIGLSDELRNAIFADDIDLEGVYIPTEYMSKNIYRSAIEIYHELADKDEKELTPKEKQMLNDAERTIGRMILRGTLGEDELFDYANILISKNSKRANHELNKLMCTTTNKNILALAKNIRSEIVKATAHTNPYMDNEQACELVDEYIEKIKKAYATAEKSNKSAKINNDWWRYIAGIAHSHTLRDEQYEYILQNVPAQKGFYTDMAINENTPIWVLSKIANMGYDMNARPRDYVKTAPMAFLHKELREKNIPANIIKKILYIHNDAAMNLTVAPMMCYDMDSLKAYKKYREMNDGTIEKIKECLHNTDVIYGKKFDCPAFMIEAMKTEAEAWKLYGEKRIEKMTEAQKVYVESVLFEEIVKPYMDTAQGRIHMDVVCYERMSKYCEATDELFASRFPSKGQVKEGEEH